MRTSSERLRSAADDPGRLIALESAGERTGLTGQHFHRQIDLPAWRKTPESVNGDPKMAKLPSIRTVAERAGVSTATVSNVLNRRRKVAPALIERVHAAVVELGYVADIGAARLRSRRSTVVGVVVPDFANAYYGRFVSVLERAAHAAGYELMLVSCNGNVEIEAKRLRSLMTWRPAGIVLLPCNDEFIRLPGTPMVVADRIPERLDVDAVGIDNRAAAFEATRHLIDQGHTRLLAVACGGMTIRNVAERCQGFLAACVGRATASILEVGLSMEECSTALVRHLSSLPERPAALFTSNNTATMGALEAFTALGLRIGRDIAIAGFDYEAWMAVVTPPLTTVRQPVLDLAQATWDRLQARIEGDTSVPGEIRLDCILEVRASSQALRREETPEAA